MNLFEYVPLMKEMNTPTAIAGVVIIALFLVIAIWKMFRGMRQGFWRQLINTARCVVAAVLSFTISSLISGGIIGAFNSMSFSEAIAWLDRFNLKITDKLGAILSCISPEAFEYLLLLPAAVIIVPLVFLLLFILLNSILRIVSGIIIKVLGFEKAKSAPSRLGGALIAGVEAVIVFTIFVTPAAGALNIIDDSYDIIFVEQENREDEKVVEQYETAFMPFVTNPAISFVDKIGAKQLSASFATVKLEGERVDVRRDIMDIIHIALVELPVLKGADFNNLTENSKTAISSILESIDSSPFLSNIFVGIVHGASGAIESGIIPIDTGEFSDVLAGVTGYLSSFSTRTLSEDLTTIKDLYFALSDGGILSAIKSGDTNIMSLLDEKRKEGDDVFARIIEILKSNQRTSALMTSITKALISTISSTITVDGVEIEVTYDDVKESVSEVLSVKKDDFATEEEYKEELSSTLDKALTDNGIELDDEIIDGIADYIDENYSDVAEVVGELTDEQFNDILLEYYDVYLDYINNGTLPEGVPEDIIEQLPEDIIEQLP